MNKLFITQNEITKEVKVKHSVLPFNGETITVTPEEGGIYSTTYKLMWLKYNNIKLPIYPTDFLLNNYLYYETVEGDNYYPLYVSQNLINEKGAIKNKAEKAVKTVIDSWASNIKQYQYI